MASRRLYYGSAGLRILEINPNATVHTYKTFYVPQTADQFDFTQYDYVVDAIDPVTGKLELAEQAQKAGVSIISSMGAGRAREQPLCPFGGRTYHRWRSGKGSGRIGKPDIIYLDY